MLSAGFGAGVQRRAFSGGRLNTLLNEPAQDLLMGNSRLFWIFIEVGNGGSGGAVEVPGGIFAAANTLRRCLREMAQVPG